MKQNNFFENIKSNSTVTDELKKDILACFVWGTPMIEKEIAETACIATQKTKVLLKQLVDENYLVVTQTVNGNRSVNLYWLA